MLVLSRHRDETLCIGDTVKITVVDIRGDKVRLGIDAPNCVPVHRLEVYNAIKREHGSLPEKSGRPKEIDLIISLLPKEDQRVLNQYLLTQENIL
jgi:carbon storage regulator